MAMAGTAINATTKQRATRPNLGISRRSRRGCSPRPKANMAANTLARAAAETTVMSEAYQQSPIGPQATRDRRQALDESAAPKLVIVAGLA